MSRCLRDRVSGTAWSKGQRLLRRQARELTIDDVSPDRVRARRVDGFSDVAAGAGGGCPAAALPAADCVQTTTLDYELRQPCAKACIQSGQVVDPDHPFPSLSCSC